MTVKTSVFVGMSVDGFIARSDGSFDFLDVGGGSEPHGYEEFISTIDALAIGRNTYEVVLAMGGWFYGEKPVFVLSSKPLAPAPAGAVIERLSGDPPEIVSALEDRGIGHVYVDGGYTVQQFLNAGLIDRIIISRLPVLIGTGISLFGPLSKDIVLNHVRTTEFKGGLIQSEYEIPRSSRS